MIRFLRTLRFAWCNLRLVERAEDGGEVVSWGFSVCWVWRRKAK